MRRLKRGRALVVAAGAAIALGAVPVSGHAAEADHCLEPPYTESAPHCACVAIGQVVQIVFPDTWGCA